MTALTWRFMQPQIKQNQMDCRSSPRHSFILSGIVGMQYEEWRAEMGSLNSSVFCKCHFQWWLFNKESLYKVDINKLLKRKIRSLLNKNLIRLFLLTQLEYIFAPNFSNILRPRSTAYYMPSYWDIIRERYNFDCDFTWISNRIYRDWFGINKHCVIHRFFFQFIRIFSHWNDRNM